MKENNDWSVLIDKFDKICEEYLVKKLPALPKNAKESIVKYGPYVDVVLMVLMLPVVLSIFGIGALFSTYGFWTRYLSRNVFSIGTVVCIIQLVLNALALPGLFKKQMTGWKYMFWATLVYAVQSLLAFNLGNLLIGTAVSLYVLYQVKSYYK